MTSIELSALMVKVPFSERQALVARIDHLHRQGIRLDPKLVAKVKAYAEPAPKRPATKTDEPTPQQLRKLLEHFGKA